MNVNKKWLFISIFIFVVVAAIAIAVLLHNNTKPKNQFTLSVASFNQLPGWQQDNQSAALAAFVQSCANITKPQKNPFLGEQAWSGNFSDWQNICKAASKIKLNDPVAARNFFQTQFQPYLVSNGKDNQGLFTGYYLPLLNGSLTPSKTYDIPIYGKPNDLVSVDLGLFKPNLKGIIIKGQLINGNLYPYPSQRKIDRGAITKTAPVLVWVNSKIDRFFLAIQGSGLVKLTNGKVLLLGYADSNGRAYTAIGKYFVDQGILTKENISKNTIVAWLKTHPDQVDSILDKNASFVFFRILNNDAPLGTEAVPLTPQRSLAVDSQYIPLGAPIWLDTTLPTNSKTDALQPFQHLLIAQDTGGAIKGIVRGDVYWGAGETAENIASDMKNSGRYWILLPKTDNLSALPKKNFSF